jgi:HEAT repeat protein
VNAALASAFELEPSVQVRRELLLDFARRIHAIGPDAAGTDPATVALEDQDAFFRKAAFDPDASIRVETMKILAERGAPRDVAIVEDVLENPGSPDVRRAALAAFGATGGEAVLPKLVELAGDADGSVRAGALEGLAQVRSAAGVAALAQIASR